MNDQDIDFHLNELARADRGIHAPERLRDLMRELEAGEPTRPSGPRAVAVSLFPMRGRPIGPTRTLGPVRALGMVAVLTLCVVSLAWVIGPRLNGAAPGQAGGSPSASTSTAPTPSVAERQHAALLNLYANVRRYANDEHVHEMDCFPTTVGASQQAVITQTITTNPLTVPLPVTCTVVSMDPYPLPGWAPPKYGWTVTLSQSWLAGPDYPAGYATYRFDTEPDGSLIHSSFIGGSGPIIEGKGDTLPAYPHVGTSKYSD